MRQDVDASTKGLSFALLEHNFNRNQLSFRFVIVAHFNTQSQETTTQRLHLPALCSRSWKLSRSLLFYLAPTLTSFWAALALSSKKVRAKFRVFARLIVSGAHALRL